MFGVFVVSILVLFGVPLMTWIYLDTLKTKVQAEKAVRKIEKFLQEQEKDNK